MEHICAEYMPISALIYPVEKTMALQISCQVYLLYLITLHIYKALQPRSTKKQRQLEAALPRNCNRHHGTCTGQDRGVSKVKAFKSDDVGLIHTEGMAWV